MIGDSYLLGYVAIALCLIASLLFLAAISHDEVRHKSLMVAGGRIMIAGFTLAAVRLWFLPLYPIPLGLVSYILLAIGSIFMCFQRVCDTCENIKKEEYFKQLGGH